MLDTSPNCTAQARSLLDDYQVLQCHIPEQEQVVFEKRIPNDLEKILFQLKPYHPLLHGLVVESTYNWYWLVDGLMAAGYSVHLANTAAIKQYDGLKHTNDHSDARWLAQLLRLNILPTGYIYPKEERAVRVLMRLPVREVPVFRVTRF